MQYFSDWFEIKIEQRIELFAVEYADMCQVLQMLHVRVSHTLSNQSEWTQGPKLKFASLR